MLTYRYEEIFLIVNNKFNRSRKIAIVLLSRRMFVNAIIHMSFTEIITFLE